MLRPYLILSGDLTHAFDLTFCENGMNSMENVPSLKRAGAVLFLQSLLAIVDPEKLSQTVMVQRKLMKSCTLQVTTLEYA